MIKLSPTKAKALIKKLYEKSPETVICLVGNMGIGKTRVITDLAKELKVLCSLWSIAQDSPEDVAGMPDTGVASAIAGKETPPHVEYKLPQPFMDVVKAGEGFLFYDEFNRGLLESQQVIFPVIEEGKRTLRNTKLPDKVMVVLAMNPDNGFYHVNPLPPALKRRTIMIDVIFDHTDFMSHIKEEWNPLIVEFLRMYPDHCWIDPAKLTDKESVPPTPAGWETINRLFTVGVLTVEEIQTPEAAALIQGKVGEAAYVVFMKHVAERMSKPVTGMEILTNYKKVREKFIKDCKESLNDRVSVTINDVIFTFKNGHYDDIVKCKTNLLAFMKDSDISVGHRSVIMKKCLITDDKFDKRSILIADELKRDASVASDLLEVLSSVKK